MSESVKLSDLIDNKRPEEGVWVQYMETSFHVCVTFYGKPQMLKMSEAVKINKMDMRTLQMVEDMDKTKFRQLYAKKIIKDWKGLTVEVLRRFVILNSAAGVPDETEIPCTDENKEMLIKESLEFDQWLSTVTQKVETFNEQKKDEELKN